MRKEIRIVGFGGQGAITAGYILGRASVIYDNKNAVITEGYSPYITGGWSRADVIIADEPIDFPLINELDILVAMYQEGFDMNCKLVKKEGIIIVEKDLVKEKNFDRKILTIPAVKIAENLGKRIVTNIVLLGSLVAVLNFVSPISLKKALADRFPKAKYLNFKAFDIGYEIALKEIEKNV